MTEQALARARAGNEEAFRDLTDPCRRELQLHIYRIVGSVQDAEDLLQETLLAAWRGLERFEGRSSVRAWLYGIATNRSLDALRASRRRARPGAATERRARAGHRRPPRGRLRGGRHRRRRRPVDRRRLAGHAARAQRIPGPRRDRRLPDRPRRPPRRVPAAGADARQRPARLRLLLPVPAHRDRATIRTARPHAGGLRPDRTTGHHATVELGSCTFDGCEQTVSAMNEIPPAINLARIRSANSAAS